MKKLAWMGTLLFPVLFIPFRRSIANPLDLNAHALQFTTSGSTTTLTRYQFTSTGTVTMNMQTLYQNCLTHLSVACSSTMTLNILDAGTTDYTIGNATTLEREWETRNPHCTNVINSSMTITVSGGSCNMNFEGFAYGGPLQ